MVCLWSLNFLNCAPAPNGARWGGGFCDRFQIDSLPCEVKLALKITQCGLFSSSILATPRLKPLGADCPDGVSSHFTGNTYLSLLSAYAGLKRPVWGFWCTVCATSWPPHADILSSVENPTSGLDVGRLFAAYNKRKALACHRCSRARPGSQPGTYTKPAASSANWRCRKSWPTRRTWNAG